MNDRENKKLRGLLLWALYHHQGGHSLIGQPIRKALGIGANEALTSDQVREAQESVAGIRHCDSEEENKVKYFYVLVSFYHKESNEIYISKSIGITVEEAVLNAVPQRFLIDRNKFLQDYTKTMTTATSILGVEILAPQHMKGMLKAMLLVDRGIVIDWVEVSKEAYSLLRASLEN